eukprot:sb/3471490/
MYFLREFELTVIPSGYPIPSLTTPWILDIDLDFFSTQNPFRSVLGPHFTKLKTLFAFHPDGKTPEEQAERRRKQLKELKRKCKNDPELAEARDCVSKDEEIIELGGLFYAAQQTDLPEHISSESEVLTMMGEVRGMLAVEETPVAVTIARSEGDAYSVAHSVDWIQKQTLGMLEKLWPVQQNL